MFDTDQPTFPDRFDSADASLDRLDARLLRIEYRLNDLSATLTALQTSARRRPRQTNWAAIVGEVIPVVFVIAMLAFLLLAELVTK